MKPNVHHVLNYAFTAIALGIAISVAVVGWRSTRSIEQHAARLDGAVSHLNPVKYSRHSWDTLTQDQVIALGEALKRDFSDVTVTLYCASSECDAVRTDFDDAFQIAGYTSVFEDRSVDSESDTGLFVGPPGKAAEALAADIEKATGIKATLVPIDVEGLGLIFGKKP